LRGLRPAEQASFERLVLSYSHAAFNLTYWLLPSRVDAQDVAQDALLRAYRCFRGFQGGEARAWLLRIVHNACYLWLKKNRSGEPSVPFDEELHLQIGVAPESLATTSDDLARLTRALKTLPPRLREVLLLRELEGCSYKEIAAITSIPVDTIMSALSRARRQLCLELSGSAGKEALREM
jgi:RNA polymerase sigma-70 factor (ECF subfamily)